MYTFLTAFRDFRDNFSGELWVTIGYKGDMSIYSSSETLVALIVLLVLGFAFYFKDNRKALTFYHFLLLIGCSVLGFSTYLFQTGNLNPFNWMVISGFGLYICYVPFNCLFFDRFVGAFRIKGNAGFLIYLADSLGYLGTVGVLLYKNFGQSSLSWIDFFKYSAYSVSGIGVFVTISSILYLDRKYKKDKTESVTIKLVVDETNV